MVVESDAIGFVAKGGKGQTCIQFPQRWVSEYHTAVDQDLSID